MRYFVEDTIEYSSLRDILRILVKVKTLDMGYKLSDAYLNLILDFHFYGTDKSTYDIHISRSKEDKAHFKSIATVDNSKSYLKSLGIILGNGKISTEILPEISLTDSCFITLKLFYDSKDE